jgi:4-amino-4-deoxy-L-arabinose transferase-like glycosyltransferase
MPGPRATASGAAMSSAERLGIGGMLVVAFGLRLWNLGTLSLVGDEGHQALAVAGILKHGIPLVPAGTIYLRGGPYLYVEALVAALGGGVSPLTLRLPSALFGTLAILMVFLLARLLKGPRVAFIAAFLTACSLWELEMSRYARMYTLLQLAYLGTAWAFVRGYVRGEPGARLLTFAWALLAILTHQLGLFVLCWFALPLALPPESLPADLRPGRGKLRLLLLPVLALGALWLVFHQIEGRLLIRGLEPAPMPGVAPHAPGVLGQAHHFLHDHLLVPPFLLALERRSTDPGVVGLALGILTVSALAVLPGLVRPGKRLLGLGALVVLALAFANLIGFALAVLAILLVLFPGAAAAIRQRPLWPAFAGSLALAVLWGGFLIFQPAARDPGFGGPRPIAEVLGGYPPVAQRVLSWFLAGWPVMTLVVLITLAAMLIRFSADRRRTSSLLLPGFVILPLLATCISREIHNESRYHFHMYPFILIGFAVAIDLAARVVAEGLDSLTAILGQSFRTKPLATGLLATLFALAGSPDLAPGAIALFVSRDYTTPVDPIRSVLSWRPYATFHQDHEGPALHVLAELAPGDRVVVSGPTYWASIYDYYLGGRVNYAVTERPERLLKDGHVVHHVTGARCITSPAELDSMLAAESSHRIWILGDLNLLRNTNRHFSPPMKRALARLLLPPLFLGRDHDTVVARLDPRPKALGVAE